MSISALTGSKRLSTIIIAVIGLGLIGPATGQDVMILGPDQFKEDRSGAGAVLCTWSIYLSVQAETAACALSRRPVDDAIDQAIVAIDEFILANSSLHPTRAKLENFKRNAAASAVSGARRLGQQFCKREDLEMFRSPSPEKIQAGVKALLAVPREPVMNPCL
jgi:hypothetical protein